MPTRNQKNWKDPLEHIHPSPFPAIKSGVTQSECERIFVYGTLRNIPCIKQHFGVVPMKGEDAHMYGSLYFNPRWFPVVLQDGESPKPVPGKVLTIPQLKSNPKLFDSYESCDNTNPKTAYYRIQQEVKLTSGEKATAWAYIGNPENRIVNETCQPKHLKPDLYA